MPLTRVIRKGGSTIMVEAHAEVLFARNAQIGRWTAIFTERVHNFTRDLAPGNSRPRWAHSGTRLRSSFDSVVQPNPAGMEVAAAVGSSADHALYVNDGTGIYNGRAPYKAKILPPWQRGDPSLYEHTWRPGGRAKVREVWIRGQKGQHFFERGIERAFQSMLMRSYQLPDDPRTSPAQIAAAQKLQAKLVGFKASSAFVAELEQWRAWRDARWNQGGALGPRGRVRRRRGIDPRVVRPYAGRYKKPRRQVSDAERRAKDAARAKKYRDNMKKKGQKPKRSKNTKGPNAQAKAAMSNYMRAWNAQNPGWRILRADRNGFWVKPRGGGAQRRVNWTARIIDLLYGRS